MGVEVPNQESNIVGLKELMESESFQKIKGNRLRIALGEDVKGQPIVADLARMPHLLIAGATGSGKSVCINSHHRLPAAHPHARLARACS